MTDGPPRLLLDEMFSPQVAEQLRRRGHDVVALVADAELRALPDDAVHEWAGGRGRRVVTENVQDFRALVADGEGCGVLFTGRSFPRSRRNLGPLVDALDSWLAGAAAVPRPLEDWVRAR